MTHFGIICPPYPGHINPLAALGRELRSRHHAVTFLQISDLELKICSEGLNFYPIGQSLYQPGSLSQTFYNLAKFSEIEALRYSVDFCQQMADMICQDAPTAIQKIGIDALLVDQLEPVGETIAQFLNLPYICISSGQAILRRADIPPFFTPWTYRQRGWARLRNQIAYTILDRSCQPILNTINRYRRQWKLPDYQHIYATSAQLAHLSQQPAAFDFPCPDLPPHFHYLGPFRNSSPQNISFPFDRLTGQPLIYASLGSVQNTKEKVFHAIAAACANLDVQLAIAHGGGMTTEAINQLPGNPLVVDYAPQLEVLSYASLTITHGGMNTVLDSLAYGIPLVALPITFEQPGTGARIKWTGTGEVISISKLTVPRLRKAIKRVLNDDFYLKNALKVQQSIHEAGGVKRAADIIEKAIVSLQPVVSSVRS